MAYLDDTGLAYFWGKIKAWANSVFALLGHTHPSSDVTAMTGYSMPASTGAISSGDTLNQAVGKLEKAIYAADISNVVHRTGDETVAGTKTFTSNIYTTYEAFRNASNITRGTRPSEDKFCPIISALDANGKFLWRLHGQYQQDGVSVVRLYAYDPNTTDNSNCYFAVGYSAAGIPIALCPSTSDARSNGGDILTRDWIPKDTRIVHTTGTEEIGGRKNFTDSVAVIEDYPTYYWKTTLITKGGTLSSEFNDWPLQCIDKNNTRIGGIHFRKYTNGGNRFELICYNPKTAASVEDYASIAVAYSNDSTPIPYAMAPSTRSDRSEGTDIVTRNWIPNDTRIVHTSGNETVDGVKTFSSNPWISNSDPGIRIRNTSYDHTSTSSNGYNENVIFQDKNSVTVSYIRHRSSSITGGCTNMLDFYVNKRNTSTSLSVQMRYDSDSNQYFFPADSNSIEVIKLGSGGHRWGQFFTTTAPNVSSDERLKQQIASVPDEVLDAWEEISFCQYKLNGSVAEKGESARFHTGLVAQRVAEAFAVRGLDAAAYGLFCWDGWDAEEDSGVEAGDAYSLRYEEALCMEAACMRRENARLKKRVADLEERLAALELKIA